MPFLIIGFTFFILSLTTDQSAFLPIGLAFITIGIVNQRKTKKKEEDEISA